MADDQQDIYIVIKEENRWQAKPFVGTIIKRKKSGSNKYWKVISGPRPRFVGESLWFNPEGPYIRPATAHDYHTNKW